MTFGKPVSEIIEARYSCRTYQERPLASETQQRLSAIVASLDVGPFGTSPRFELVAATGDDRAALKGLGTYGFIKAAAGFILGAMRNAPKNAEDYGYLMETIVLHATDLGLGTCWLGGSFTKSSFAAKIGAGDGETVPAVVATGHIAERPRALDSLVRRTAGSDRRLPWDKLFFSGSLGAPLPQDEAGAYAAPLEMVRLGPSASNKQPWRVVKLGTLWHFYLSRTRGYGQGRLAKGMAPADMQRLDMGIAMCHFERTAAELGLAGRWVVEQPGLGELDDLTEYTASWASQG